MNRTKNIQTLQHKFLTLQGIAGILLISVTVLACSRQTPTDPANSGSRSEEQATVIEATPLDYDSIIPRKLSSNQPGLNPWIQSEFLGSLQSSNSTTQGLWVQSSKDILANHQAQTPLPAASVTKVATALAALQRLGPNFRFVTQFGTTGSIKNGTLEGDLVILGGDDPLFIWEEAFAVANLLNTLGIETVTGDLVVQSPFVMNFEADPQQSASLFLQSLNAQSWPPEAIAQFDTLPPQTPKPNLTLQGNIRLVDAAPPETTWRVKHASLPLIELLKRMNRYSNNPMADQIANHLGGASEVTKIVRSLTNLSPQEVHFINGSGLGPENQITPQGASLMLQALAALLQSQGLSLGDVLTIVGKDEGILDPRPLPPGLVVKSGTLDQVSTLAGVLPTQNQGLVWFTMLNYQGDVETFRQSQEALLNKMAATWGTTPNMAPLAPTLDPDQLQSLTQGL